MSTAQLYHCQSLFRNFVTLQTPIYVPSQPPLLSTPLVVPASIVSIRFATPHQSGTPSSEATNKAASTESSARTTLDEEPLFDATASTEPRKYVCPNEKIVADTFFCEDCGGAVDVTQWLKNGKTNAKCGGVCYCTAVHDSFAYFLVTSLKTACGKIVLASNFQILGYIQDHVLVVTDRQRPLSYGFPRKEAEVITLRERHIPNNTFEALTAVCCPRVAIFRSVPCPHDHPQIGRIHVVPVSLINRGVTITPHASNSHLRTAPPIGSIALANPSFN